MATTTTPLPTTRAYAHPSSTSARLYQQAQAVMPGGNSRTSVFMAPYPPYAAEGEGCWVLDVDGDRRLDLLNNYTSLIHGHAHPAITAAATRRLARGASFPMPTPEEVELASLLVERLPAVDQVRFTNSGSEAVMMAMKAARGFTGRPKIAKFEGAYHGSYDYAEVSLGSTAENWGPLAEPASVAYSRGTAPSVLADVVVLPFNRPELAARLIERHARELAAVIIDPVPNRVGLMPATPELLETLRAVTAAHGILLIFDEVISFRIGYHGAQGYFGARPDLTSLGKIIGGGFPVGAVGGRAEVMAVFDPRGGHADRPARRDVQRQSGDHGGGAGGDAAARRRELSEDGRSRGPDARRARGLLQGHGRRGQRHRAGLAVRDPSQQPHAGGLSQQPARRPGGGAARSRRPIPARPWRAAVDHRPRMPVDAHGGALKSRASSRSSPPRSRQSAAAPSR